MKMFLEPVPQSNPSIESPQTFPVQIVNELIRFWSELELIRLTSSYLSSSRIATSMEVGKSSYVSVRIFRFRSINGLKRQRPVFNLTIFYLRRQFQKASPFYK